MKYVMIIGILLLTLLAGCSTNEEIISISPDVSDVSVVEDLEINVEKIELYHFYGTTQCFSCKTIKLFAERTVNAYYYDLIESGVIEFNSIDVDLPENKEVVMKYGATGSSLWIGTYIDGEFYKEENKNVWYKVRDEKDFLNYLKGFLAKRLKGDLS